MCIKEFTLATLNYDLPYLELKIQLGGLHASTSKQQCAKGLALIKSNFNVNGVPKQVDDS